MASARSNKSKSSGLRILWIPGRRKSHPKGRYDATNKQVSYSTKQKNNEMWSLGGNKAQTDIIKTDSQSGIIDTPSVSGLAAPVTCAIGATAVAAKCAASAEDEQQDIQTSSVAATEPSETTDDVTPQSPTSTTSTAPLLSTPNSPQAATPSISVYTMPSKTTATPAIITTTTTVEIMDENRFAMGNKGIPANFNIYDLPLPPKGEPKMLVTSKDATNIASPSVLPQTENAEHTGATKKVARHHRNHNNNHQSDVNSIESISDNANISSLADMAWIDDLMASRQNNDEKVLAKNGKRKPTKKIATVKERDQLDGVPSKPIIAEPEHEDDEKLVRCLYFSLMCCDCSIS